MTESQVSDDLLRLSQEFGSTYWLCQHLKQAIKHKYTTLLSDLMNRPNSHVAESMKSVLKTLKKQELYIINALTYPYSNEKLEGTNNLIKVIKRIAFGYHDLL